MRRGGAFDIAKIDRLRRARQEPGHPGFFIAKGGNVPKAAGHDLEDLTFAETTRQAGALIQISISDFQIGGQKRNDTGRLRFLVMGQDPAKPSHTTLRSACSRVVVEGTGRRSAMWRSIRWAEHPHRPEAAVVRLAPSGPRGSLCVRGDTTRPSLIRGRPGSTGLKTQAFGWMF